MKRRLAGLAAVLALAAAGPAAGVQAASHGPTVVAAHACSAGYKHGVIALQHKCLKAGQFCKRGYDRQYHRYGFHCHRSNGSRLRSR
jgi:hypothetical protein